MLFREFVGLGLAFFVLMLTGQWSLSEEKTPPEFAPFTKTDWPWWRGPFRNGTSFADPALPTQWSDTENIAWKAPVPGRGHGSPTVVGKQVVLATADHDAKIQWVLSFDRSTGKELWRTKIHEGGFETKGNNKSSLASSTVACDGQRFFVNFLHAEAIYTTALSLSGEIEWQVKITDYVLHQGFASSPAIVGPLVIVSADNKGTGLLAGLERTTGKVVWQQSRPKMPNYTSPIILTAAGKEQLFFTGCDLVTSLDPRTGKSNWEIPGSTTECVTSTVTDGQRIITSGGYPKNHLSAVKADGSGKIEWENNSRVYVPSMIIRDGALYAVLDAGVAQCWDSATGNELWKARLDGTFSASLTLAGDNLYATNEAGKTFVFKARPDKYEAVGENQLSDEVFATPTLVGGKIYYRGALLEDGARQEMLYCIAKDTVPN